MWTERERTIARTHRSPHDGGVGDDQSGAAQDLSEQQRVRACVCPTLPPSADFTSFLPPNIVVGTSTSANARAYARTVSYLHYPPLHARDTRDAAPLSQHIQPRVCLFNVRVGCREFFSPSVGCLGGKVNIVRLSPLSSSLPLSHTRTPGPSPSRIASIPTTSRPATLPSALANNRYAHAPELNDVLHLHCKGIAEVTNLEEYTGLKAIYLESNSVEELDGAGLLHTLEGTPITQHT